MTTRTITAIFDSADEAQRAQERLLGLGLTSSDVRIMNQNDGVGVASEHRGFWQTLKEMFTDDDRETYTEGVRRGGYLLTATVEDESAEAACRILEDSNAVDLDRRAEQWRSEGWAGGQRATEPATGSSGSIEGAAGEREEAIPIVRERLRVGKREVNRGGVRVRSYVVEEPVDEQVDLREERVEVERRPVGQAVRGDAGDLLQDRTIEVTENAEEAVIAKEAEVSEEVVVRKFEGHRTEGVSDTVRHTEVDVEDTREAPSSPADPKTRRSETSKRPNR
jgi:uncharacterized protein (TIGR02271 family)